jgi:transposase InsO family protein
MKHPVYEQIQARKVKARLRMLQHAKRLSGNASQTCRFFGVSRALYYISKKRYEKNGLAGLRDLPRSPHHIKFHIPPEIVSLILRIREERRYGAVRVSLYLQRHYVREHFAFAIQKIQTDNGSSFGPQFTWHLSDLRISHKHIPPGCPEVNGKVERSHKTDSEEFYQGRHFKQKRDLARKLKNWETEYNQDRPHLALKGKTPWERVHELIHPPKPVRDLC